jgi:DNA-binding transcriptional regulator YiaG
VRCRNSCAASMVRFWYLRMVASSISAKERDWTRYSFERIFSSLWTPSPPRSGRVALLGIAQRHIRISYTHNLRKRKQCKPLPTSIKALGDWIQVKRQQKKISPYHLAAKMGIATALVHSWENGTCEPDERQRTILGNLLEFHVRVNLPKHNS